MIILTLHRINKLSLENMWFGSSLFRKVKKSLFETYIAKLHQFVTKSHRHYSPLPRQMPQARRRDWSLADRSPLRRGSSRPKALGRLARRHPPRARHSRGRRSPGTAGRRHPTNVTPGEKGRAASFCGRPRAGEPIKSTRGISARARVAP